MSLEIISGQKGPILNDLSYYEALDIPKKKADLLRKDFESRIFRAAQRLKPSEPNGVGSVISLFNISDQREKNIIIPEIGQNMYSLEEIEKMMQVVTISMAKFGNGIMNSSIRRNYFDGSRTELSDAFTADTIYEIDVFGTSFSLHKINEVLLTRENKYQRLKSKSTTLEYYLTRN